MIGTYICFPDSRTIGLGCPRPIIQGFWANGDNLTKCKVSSYRQLGLDLTLGS